MKFFVRLLAVFVLLMLIAPSSFALNVQSFIPKSDRKEAFHIHGTSGIGAGNFQVGFFYNYVRNPLKFTTTDGPDTIAEVISSFHTVDTILSFGLTDGISLDVTLPFNTLTNFSGDQIISNESEFSVGDLRALLSINLANNQKNALGLALYPYVRVPLDTDTTDFFNNTGPQYGLTLAVDRWFDKQNYLALNLGGSYRQSYGDEVVQDIIPIEKEITGGLSYVHAFNEARRSDVFVEVQTSTAADAIYQTKITSPVEGLVGYRARFGNAWTWTIGGGSGFFSAYSAPDLRLFTGLIYRGERKDSAPAPQVLPAPTPAPTPKKEIAKLSVDIVDDKRNPIEATVEVKDSEGKTIYQGEAGKFERLLSPGRYLVRVSKPGFTSHTREVLLNNGKKLSVQMRIGEIKKQGEKIEFNGQIFFDLNSAELRADSFTVLSDVIDILNRHTEVKRIRIEAHTDSQGSQKYNMNLSEKRAESVMNYFIRKGMDPRRLSYQGYGESRPIASNTTAEGRAKNRRVEFNVLETNTP